MLAKRLVDAKGSELKVGEPIALIVDDAEAYKQFLALGPDAHKASAIASPAPSSTLPGAPAASSAGAKASEAPAPEAHSGSHGPKRISPAARHHADSKGVDLSKVKATAFGGSIVSKGDVLEAIKAGNVNSALKHSKQSTATSAPAPAPAAASPPASSSSTASPVDFYIPLNEPVNNRFKDIPNNNMRKVIAKRLTESKATVPHLYVTAEINIDSLLSMRKQIKKEYDINVSVNDVVIKAAALALRDHPNVNSKWDKSAQQVVESPAVDISVAVATPNGLITPIVKGAEKRGLVNISQVRVLPRVRNGIINERYVIVWCRL